jgi:hypothetical protein
MHSPGTVEAALEMSRSGAGASEIGARLGVSRRTISDWLRGDIPHAAHLGACPRCFAHHNLAALPSEYVYLLGLYLRDGCLALHKRNVYKLRITLDRKYPGIIEEAAGAVAVISGRAHVLKRSDNCVEVYSFWRPWICHLPQHGPGKKHDRVIQLTHWQQDLVDRWPELPLRGLIQSDGCRFVSTRRCNWSAPRYSLSNRSADIHGIFRRACELVALSWTIGGPYTTYVSRKADVARLDEFIGPKR